jgi:hypothetical protein
VRCSHEGKEEEEVTGVTNRKGAVGMVAATITVTLLAILVASLLIPQVQNTTKSQSYTENLVKVNASANEEFTLDKASDGLTLETATLSVSGLALTTNYTVNYDTGVVTINNVTAAGTYPATYKYYTSTYLDNSAERTLMAIVVLAGIIGLVVLVFRGFGLMD